MAIDPVILERMARIERPPPPPERSPHGAWGWYFVGPSLALVNTVWFAAGTDDAGVARAFAIYTLIVAAMVIIVGAIRAHLEDPYESMVHAVHPHASGSFQILDLLLGPDKEPRWVTLARLAVVLGLIYTGLLIGTHGWRAMWNG